MIRIYEILGEIKKRILAIGCKIRFLNLQEAWRLVMILTVREQEQMWLYRKAHHKTPAVFRLSSILTCTERKPVKIYPNAVLLCETWTRLAFMKQWRRMISCSVGSLAFINSIGFVFPGEAAHQFSQAISKLSSNREETEKQFSKS